MSCLFLHHFLHFSVMQDFTRHSFPFGQFPALKISPTQQKAVLLLDNSGAVPYAKKRDRKNAVSRKNLTASVPK